MSPEQIERETVRVFFPGSPFHLSLVLEFLKAIQTPAEFPYVLDLDIRTADRFIDADTFATSNNKLELAKYLITPAKKGQKIFLSVASVNHVYNCFIDYANEIKERYPWIYNPPLIPSTNAGMNSLRQEYAKDFVIDYGAYMEIIYVIAAGDWTKKETIEEWPLHKFLFIGEYMLRKRKIESI